MAEERGTHPLSHPLATASLHGPFRGTSDQPTIHVQVDQPLAHSDQFSELL
jgi:hypothetical protein